MKKSLLSGIGIISFVLPLITVTACSNSQESKLVYTESDTIKKTVKEKEQDISWTLELEGERLSQTIKRNSITIGADVPYTRDIFKISRKNHEPVYPSIDDFGSLDTRNLKPVVKEKLNKFYEGFTSDQHSGVPELFSKKYIFNYVFFLNDFEEGWKKNFEIDLPSEDKLFTKCIFGEPFIGSEIIQIPVRFYADCGTIDMTVFLSASGNNEFYQITIDRWQKV